MRQHAEETGSTVAEELLADWPTSLARFTEVIPRDFRIVMEAKAKAEADGLDEQRDRHGDDGGAPWLTDARTARRRAYDSDDGGLCQWLTPRASSSTAARAPRAPGRGAHAGLERGLPGRPGPGAAADHQDPGRPLHGLRHPVLPPGLPAGQHHPGVERPGLARRLGRRDRAAARDQQLPGVHRSALPGAVRDRLRARHQPGPGDDQERRGLDHRPGLGVRRRAPAAAGVALGQDRRRDRLRPGRSRRRPAAHPRRPHRRGLRARRQDRRPAALRHPRVQDGEEGPRPAPGPDASRGHRLPGRRRRRRDAHR